MFLPSGKKQSQGSPSRCIWLALWLSDLGLPLLHLEWGGPSEINKSLLQVRCKWRQIAEWTVSTVTSLAWASLSCSWSLDCLGLMSTRLFTMGRGVTGVWPLQSQELRTASSVDQVWHMVSSCSRVASLCSVIIGKLQFHGVSSECWFEIQITLYLIFIWSISAY